MALELRRVRQCWALLRWARTLNSVHCIAACPCATAGGCAVDSRPAGQRRRVRRRTCAGGCLPLQPGGLGPAPLSGQPPGGRGAAAGRCHRPRAHRPRACRGSNAAPQHAPVATPGCPQLAAPPMGAAPALRSPPWLSVCRSTACATPLRICTAWRRPTWRGCRVRQLLRCFPPDRPGPGWHAQACAGS